MQKKIELFHKQMCTSSAKVRRYIESNNLKNQVKFNDIDEKDWARQQLLELTGAETVPMLLVDGEPHLESEVIVQWLKSHLVDKTAN